MAQGDGILIVDDDPLVRDVLGDMVRLIADRCVTCPSGTEALALLSEDAFEAVLCDLQMPDMDGIEVLRWLARERPDTTRVAISGFLTLEREQQLAKARIFILRKPFRMDQLTSALRQARTEQGHD